MQTPASLEEASSALAGLAAQRLTVGITGADAPRGAAAVAVDEIVSTRLLDRIVDYAPSDQIVTVEAGMTVARLQAALRERNQRLALDPPQPDRTTIGGAVAAASYGPLRTRYGTAKDLIVGMTIVRADGTMARGGGKVVKNVAGFDIPKLMVGTYGTLALIGTVTFRLHPLAQQTSEAVFQGCDAEAIRRIVVAMTDARLEPSATFAVYDGAAYALCVRFEGFRAGVAAQRDTLAEIAGLAPSDSSLDALHDAARTFGELQVKITAPASRLGEMHERAIAPVFGALDDARCTVYPSVGVAFAGGRCTEMASVLTALQETRSWAEAAGGTLVTTQAPAALRAAFDPWGTPPPSFALMRELKQRFDPERRLNPGGFVGGL